MANTYRNGQNSSKGSWGAKEERSGEEDNIYMSINGKSQDYAHKV